MADALIFGEGAGTCAGLDIEDQTCSTRNRIANTIFFVLFHALVWMAIDQIESIIPRSSSDLHYPTARFDRLFFGFFLFTGLFHLVLMISREPRSRSSSRYPQSKALIVSLTTIYGFNIKRFMVGPLLPFSFKFAFGLIFWLDRSSGTVAPIAIVLLLIDRPHCRLCNDIYVRKIPSHGLFARQQTMFIVVLDVFW